MEGGRSILVAPLPRLYELPPFPGFTSEAFQFLRDLARNNDRDWFTARKETYESELKEPLALLLRMGRVASPKTISR
jgi:hypothetical protein